MDFPTFLGLLIGVGGIVAAVLTFYTKEFDDNPKVKYTATAALVTVALYALLAPLLISGSSPGPSSAPTAQGPAPESPGLAQTQLAMSGTATAVQAQIVTLTQVAAVQTQPAQTGAATEAAGAGETAVATPTLNLPRPTPGVLASVLGRQELVCGVDGSLPGFSYDDPATPQEDWSGFDVDFCRATAAAIFGDSSKVRFVKLTADDRFARLRAGEVDVVFRNTTWTSDRDTTETIDFGPVIFHDGQALMTRVGSNISSYADLEGKVVCVEQGTTSEANLADVVEALALELEDTLYFFGESATADMIDAYNARTCDAIASDRSKLYSLRTRLNQPSQSEIPDSAIISREPLAPAFKENDSTWADVITWVVYATIYADELGVSQGNLSDHDSDEVTDPRIARLLGYVGRTGADLGLENSFAYEIIRQVGNYDDIYNRNFGAGSSVPIDRGANRAWNKGQGGVLYAAPFR